MRKVRVPRVLWKYGSARALGVLENLELKATRPNEFNDPFEWSPGVVGVVTAQDVARFYKDRAWVTHWEAPAIDVADPVAAETEYTELAHELTETSREIMAEELSRISANYGIVCLTADPASVLMWSIEPDDGGAQAESPTDR